MKKQKLLELRKIPIIWCYRRIIEPLLWGEHVFFPVNRFYPFGEKAIRTNSDCKRFFTALDTLVEHLPDGYYLVEQEVNDPRNDIYGLRYRIIDEETLKEPSTYGWKMYVPTKELEK